MTVIKSSVFPASKEKVYEKLQKLELLQHIAWPSVFIHTARENG